MKRTVIPVLAFTVLGASCTRNPATVTNTTAEKTAPRQAIVAALSAYKNPSATTIYLYADGSNCKAEVDDDPVGAMHDRHVAWIVVNDDCALTEAYPKVQLQFKPDGKGHYPFKDPKPKSKKANDLIYIHERIQKDTEVDAGTFKYSIYLLNGKTHPAGTAVLDPDLEIEPPVRLYATSSNTTPARPQSATPPKKQ